MIMIWISQISTSNQACWVDPVSLKKYPKKKSRRYSKTKKAMFSISWLSESYEWIGHSYTLQYNEKLSQWLRRRSSWELIHWSVFGVLSLHWEESSGLNLSPRSCEIRFGMWKKSWDLLANSCISPWNVMIRHRIALEILSLPKNNGKFWHWKHLGIVGVYISCSGTNHTLPVLCRLQTLLHMW